MGGRDSLFRCTVDDIGIFRFTGLFYRGPLGTSTCADINRAGLLVGDFRFGI